MKTFEELGLSAEFVEVLKKYKIVQPSEIQEKTIPLVVAGKDVIGGSATGSGKTLAFASGIIENLKPCGKVQALIMTPTRELAEQVATSISKFSKHKKLNVLSIYGGVKIDPQILKIPDADIIVGTPGRILDHLNRDTLRLDGIKYLVLDEVDRMFDMGFQKDVEMIIFECPAKRQTMLFSATISADMDHLARKHTNKPEEVSVKSHIDTKQLKQVYYDVPDGLKFSLFVHLLKKEKAHLIMVFCGTRRNVDFVVTNLNNLGIKARAIHGGLDQNKRNRVLQDFNAKNGMNVLVCTDVAARGLDIHGVSHVYNYDLPKTSADYIHRIGRTARAGKDGIAISILCSRDYENFSNVQRDENLKIKEKELPRVERVGIIVNDRKGDRRRRDSSIKFSRRPGDGRRIDTSRKPRRGHESKRKFERGRPSTRRDDKRDFGRRNSGNERTGGGREGGRKDGEKRSFSRRSPESGRRESGRRPISQEGRRSDSRPRRDSNRRPRENGRGRRQDSKRR